MGIVKTNGIIISESNMGDFDKMLTMLTPGVRENIVCSKGGKTSKKLSFSRHTIVVLWGICNV